MPYNYDRSASTGHQAGHSGEVDLTSPVSGKATLVFDSPDFDAVNYEVPQGAVPMKTVESYLKKLVGPDYNLKALQSKYPRSTRTLDVTSTKYKLTWKGPDGPEETRLEIELSVKKSATSKTAHKYDQDFEKLVQVVDAFSEAKKKLPVGKRLLGRLKERLEAEPDQKGERVYGLNQAVTELEKSLKAAEKAVTDLEEEYDEAMSRFNKLKAR